MRLPRPILTATSGAVIALLAIALTVLAVGTGAIAQPPERPKAPALEQQPLPPFGRTKDGKLLIIGEACQRRTDNSEGRITRDFCGRFYCGRAKSPDPSEVIPDWPQRHGCTFRLVGQQCRCLTADGQPRRVHRSP
jgi:hypothetical protein